MSESHYCAALQPVCDVRRQHIADEIHYRHSVEDAHAKLDNDTIATARILNTVFYDIGLDALVGDRLVFVSAPLQWVVRPHLLPGPAERIWLNVSADEVLDSRALEAFKVAREAGYHLVVSAETVLETPELEDDAVLKSAVDMICCSAEALPDQAHLTRWQQLGLHLMATDVASIKHFEQCQAAGISWFQGQDVAQPEIHSETQQSKTGNRSVELKLLSLLCREDTDTADLEPVLLQSPDLCLKLLQYVNSSALRREKSITAVKDALTMMGNERLKKLLTTLVLSSSRPVAKLAIPQALTRAAMCRSLARGYAELDEDEAFTVGLFSMMDILSGRPLPAVIQASGLSETTCQAILNYQGELGRILLLVIQFEKANLHHVKMSAMHKLNHLYLKARVWAQDLLVSTGAG
ncbi:hypothetical protein BFW38_08920 [Terasakiispira papahanaumokuakeensis]|uniref:HDOD domain-containing protein n=1 Tax=Terasakiispira papahanaumokuakeensis TaxID=197479 RepID=A0A1E2V9F5_9GAMM|nr:HDOD domain-containing protein [Terasakiispira papahanaumokuakeensis]ODC03649.1 hypothetical protein BFW38_08920 [Terasakiispira papahanaumokuakeensis]